MKIYLFNIIWLLLAGFPGEEMMSAADKQKVVEELKTTLHAYFASVKKEGLKGEFPYLHNSPDFLWTPPGHTEAISYDSVATILTKRAPTFRSIDNTWETLKVVPLTKNIAVYSGRLHAAIVDSSGKSFEYRAVETATAVKVNGRWLLHCGQTTVVK